MKWLCLIGIGEDGYEGLSSAARKILAQAQFVIGGARHLALAGPLDAQTMAWPSPLSDGISQILARRGTPTVVLASGDPFFYGIGGLISARIPAEEWMCLPAPSSFSLAAARLGWSLQECRPISLHGRDLNRIIPNLAPSARLLCLAWDETTAPRVAQLLCERGLSQSRLIVLERMGGPNEKIHETTAKDCNLGTIDPLNLIACEIRGGPEAHYVPIGNGLPDALFTHDGQITKQEVRAITLSALAPKRGEILWDIGAGSGSVGIEWMLLDPLNQAIAIEARQDCCNTIVANAGALGVPGLEVVFGKAPDALMNLAQPHAIFIGGGASQPGIIDQAFNALPQGGRLVVNAVTLETEMVVFTWFQRLGGTLKKITLAHADRVGGFHSFRPALPITQWAVTKP
jgi:precorrin-6Y C5,15-methyltransferase (decarboxylating)